MIARLPGTPRDQPPPLVLVADEDPKVVEALVAALQEHHFRVSVASDGEEALTRARGESPDLIIAGVRLARRGGLELCGSLRREVERPDVPILLLSAANDSEARVEALAHGADDFVTKPFSPRELVARVQRLVTRARETARYRRRSQELERDMARLEGDARRAREEVERERSLRVLSTTLFSSLLHTLDLDELDARLLREICRQTGARSAALLAPERGRWSALCVRGELPERWGPLALSPRGACVEWLAALGRPALRAELERLPELVHDVGVLSAHGIAMLALVPSAPGVPSAQAMVVCDERPDGAPFGQLERERMGAILAAAAPARAAALRFRRQQDRALDLLSAPVCADPRRRDAAREARARVLPIASRMGLGAADLGVLARGLDLGPWAWGEPGRAALADLAGDDATHRCRQLRDLLRDAEACAAGEGSPDDDALTVLAATGLRYQTLRLSGRSAFESWRTAIAWLGAHGHPALREGFPELTEPFPGGSPPPGGETPATAPPRFVAPRRPDATDSSCPA